MTEERDPLLEKANRAAHRVARAEVTRRDAAEELWRAPFNSRREVGARARHDRAAKELDDAVEEYRRVSKVSTLVPGEPHYPEDWPA